MFVRYLVILCVMFVLSGCDSKISWLDNDVVSNPEVPFKGVILLPGAQTETSVEECLFPVTVEYISPTKEQELQSAISDAEEMQKHPSCYQQGDRESNALSLARLSIEVLTQEYLNTPSQVVLFKRVKMILAVHQPNLYVSRVVPELIDLYQRIDSNQAWTIAQAESHLEQIKRQDETMGLSDMVHKAILREAFVFSYRHTVEESRQIDGMLGEYLLTPFYDQLEFAKGIADRFEEPDSCVIPKAFFKDMGLNPTQNAELLAYVLTPSEELETEDLVPEVERRAAAYVAAGYDVAEVNAAALEVCVGADSFDGAVAFANKHFDEQGTSNLEDRLIKILRDRGCYAVTVDAKGLKSRTYDFSQTCAAEDEEE